MTVTSVRESSANEHDVKLQEAQVICASPVVQKVISIFRRSRSKLYASLVLHLLVIPLATVSVVHSSI